MISVVKANCLIFVGTLQDLHEQCQDYKWASVAPPMRRLRESQWRCYRRFCSQFGLKPFPCTNLQAALYMTHLAKYMSHSSIIGYVQTIIFYHNVSDIQAPSMANPSLKATLNSVLNRHGHGKNQTKRTLLRYLT